MLRFFFLLLLFLGITACNEQLKINAEEKNVWVIYGMLRGDDTLHYVRISKAFLSEKDAILTAKEADFYSPELLSTNTDSYNILSKMLDSNAVIERLGGKIACYKYLQVLDYQDQLEQLEN